jgi:ribose 5-phosphate isomerase A
LGWREGAKRRAALEAVKHVQDGFVIGLGTGSTAAYAIQELGEKIKREGLRILGVPTSHQAAMLAVRSGVPLTTLDEHPRIDLDIDGADQVDRDLNLIKGGGGALTREKVVASVAKEVVIIADETKLVESLGTSHPVPVEVLPFALRTVRLEMEGLGGKPVLREGEGKAGPVITDNGNFIVDFHSRPFEAPKEFDVKLKLIPGVIETGLFVGVADVVYLGRPSGVEKLVKRR